MGMCKPSGGINKTIYGPVRGNIEKKTGYAKFKNGLL